MRIVNFKGFFTILIYFLARKQFHPLLRPKRNARQIRGWQCGNGFIDRAQPFRFRPILPCNRPKLKTKGIEFWLFQLLNAHQPNKSTVSFDLRPTNQAKAALWPINGQLSNPW
jgi:hypothetical protein